MFLCFRSTLQEIRFAPRQVLGYSYCTSHLNKENLVNFNKHYPCDFDTPIPNKGGIVIVTFVNAGWLNLTKNWVCSARKVGLGDNILLITVERDVCSYFPDTPCHYEKGANISSTKFGQPGYQKFMIERTKIILRLLSCSIKKLVLADADIVFLKNPLHQLDLELGSRDIVLQRDSTGLQVIDSLAYNIFNYICGGFIYMNVNNKTKLLYQSVLQFQRNQSWNDQAGLNICIRHHSLHINWTLLPLSLFPNGKEYFDFWADREEPVIVHANFKSGSMEKITSMIIRDIWCYEKIAPLLCKDYIFAGCMIANPLPWCEEFKDVCLKRYFNTFQ